MKNVRLFYVRCARSLDYSGTCASTYQLCQVDESFNADRDMTANLFFKAEEMLASHYDYADISFLATQLALEEGGSQNPS